MGLMQSACETYDCFQHKAGVYEAGRVVLAPIGHLLTHASIEITIDEKGDFVGARTVEKNEPKIIIPVTEESSNRTSAPSAHPLCEQLGYLMPNDERKFKLYVEQLTEWNESEFSHPQLKPILEYVQRGTILEDLRKAGVITVDAKGQPKDLKALVRWIVLGLGEVDSGPCWENKGLMEAFQDYYKSRLTERSQELCMVTGERVCQATKHAKGIVSYYGNAKLISANDDENFTYRGRFTEPWQAVTVGYEASQKAHNALKWLVDNQSVRCGNRIFLCWNPQGNEIPPITGPMGRRNSKNQQKTVVLGDYRKQLRETLSGWQVSLSPTSNVVIAVFDAATSGRLSLTYFNELLASDFLERLYGWDTSCCWINGSFGIQSPSLYEMIVRAYGTWRQTAWKLDDGILRQQMQRMVNCRISKAAFPLDFKTMLVQRATRLHLLPKKERETLLFVTCAAIRKYHNDLTGEEYSMALDINNTDRSYLFGRLLAIAEAIEKSAYRQETERETNAMRMQCIFSQRPMYTWRVLEERLNPYYARLSPGLREYYRQRIQEIVDKLPLDDVNLNRKLDDTYLIGYYHQRAYRKNNNIEAEKSEIIDLGEE